VERLRHVLDFDESERREVWQSSTIPRVQADPGTVALASAEQAAEDYALVSRLRAAHPGVWLVHLFRARLEAGCGGAALPLGAGELSALLGPPTPSEQAALSTEAGRQEALLGVRRGVEGVAALLGTLEQDALDGGLGGAGGEAAPPLPGVTMPTLSPTSRCAALVALAARNGALAAAMASLRAVCLAHTARLDALGPGEERGAAEGAWLESLGLPLAPPPSHPTRTTSLAPGYRSPRIPRELFAHWDAPLSTPRSSAEVASEGGSASSHSQRLMGMEHRDRAELLSRAKLPTPLHAGAPTPALEAAALALEANPSLSPLDRQRMLSAYMDGLDMAPAASDFSLEKASIMDPQPQWGWYDPAVTRLQDDAASAMAGRGKFSAYRGSVWEAEALPPPSIGLPTPLHVAAGTPDTPLETMEEAQAVEAEVKRRALADSAAATAAVTAALERSMGLKPRSAAATSGGMGAPAKNFFERFSAGERPPPALQPPAKGDRLQVERKELEMGVGVKVKKPDGKKAGGKK
jgi:hypothetical protein